MKSSLANLSIRTKLLGAFAIDLLLMMALGIFAASQMSLMNERAAAIEAHTIPSLDSVAQINATINQYRIQQLEYIINTNSADKERIENNMRLLEGEMDSNFQSYRALLDTNEERTRFAAVENAWREVVSHNHSRFLPAVRLNNTGTVQPAFSRMNPLYNELVDASRKLAAQSQFQARESLDVVSAAYTRARYFIFTDTALTLIISATIGLVLSARIARRLKLLTGATQKVAAGDLERKLEVAGNDELGVLAANFNLMVDSLREKRIALEERNTELHESLERQKQLTEDIMRRKEAEEAAYRAQAAAEAASQAKSMFLATMSHELRTPLTAILGYAQLLRVGEATFGGDERTAYLERILSAGKHLTTLISNILDFSRIEQGRVDIEVNIFAIADLLNEVVSVAEPLVTRQGNQLEVVCPPTIGIMHSDAVKVRQVLFNLLSNAAKFTHEGRISLMLTREQYARRDWITFTVTDTGIGIAPEHLDRLFRPFSQVDDTPTRKYEGAGLGLALSRQLCQIMGGDITVTSVPGTGSTFSVRLPAVYEEEKSDPAQGEQVSDIPSSYQRAVAAD